MHDTDTIAAISTAPGQAGIAIIRMTGPESFPIADAVFDGKRRPSEMPPNSFAHGCIANGHTEEAALDEVILLAYRAPASYTREDVVEIQGHGGQACAARILEQLVGRGVRPAEPGEFTKRAFLNGRIDLLQAEAVADLIAARSDRAAAAAMDQLSGSLSHSCNDIYDLLVAAAADLEASFDFVEDELPETVMPELTARLREGAAGLDALLSGWTEGRLLREGALVVITGKPNVGKSTLMNRLLGRERAIVASAPGTTRDTIEEGLVLGGIPIRLVDTAGLRDSECEIEQEGVRRAVAVTDDADIRLHVLDISESLDKGASLQALDERRTILILNKCDLPQQLDPAALPVDLPTIKTALTQRKSLDELLSVIIGKLSNIEVRPPHAVISERHRSIIQCALNELNESAGHMAETGGEEPVLAAQGLRQCLEHLGKITGREYSQELLDSIFSRFCIGK